MLQLYRCICLSLIISLIIDPIKKELQHIKQIKVFKRRDLHSYQFLTFTELIHGGPITQILASHTQLFILIRECLLADFNKDQYRSHIRGTTPRHIILSEITAQDNIPLFNNWYTTPVCMIRKIYEIALVTPQMSKNGPNWIPFSLLFIAPCWT